MGTVPGVNGVLKFSRAAFLAVTLSPAAALAEEESPVEPPIIVADAASTPFTTATTAEAEAESVEPSFAAIAATENPSTQIMPFYLAISKQAFEQAYGDTLSPDKVSDFEAVGSIVNSNSMAYGRNLLQAADDYISALDVDTAKGLLDNLTREPFTNGRVNRNLMSAVKQDVVLYGKVLNGTTMRDVGSDRDGTAFYAMKTLADEGIITSNEAYALIMKIRDVTHGEKMEEGRPDTPLGMFHSALVERLGPIVDAKLAAPAVNNSAPALENPFK